MNLSLRDLSPQSYAREVLPQTQALWAHGRSFDEYAAHTIELAQTPYGRKAYRTIALCNGSAAVLASFKRYERTARMGNRQLHAIGIGAVFTPQIYRGRGYASAMLALAFDQARQDGIDFAYLFSDIHPQFYKDLGFTELSSRSISLRADNLCGDRIFVEPLEDRHWPAIRTCFDAMESQRDFALVRTPAVWNWLRKRMAHRSEHPAGQPVQLVARMGRSIAYVIGRREPRHDAFVVDEFGFRDQAARALVPSLLRCAAGDLRRIAGWLPPAPARGLLPRACVRKRSDAIWMIAPLSALGERFLQLAKASGTADGVWALDHV